MIVMERMRMMMRMLGLRLEYDDEWCVVGDEVEVEVEVKSEEEEPPRTLIDGGDDIVVKSNEKGRGERERGFDGIYKCSSSFSSFMVIYTGLKMKIWESHVPITRVFFRTEMGT